MKISEAYGYNASAFGQSGFGHSGRGNHAAPAAEEGSVRSNVAISEEAQKMANAANVIKAKYNPRNISRNELVSMAHELHANGLVGEQGMLYISILPSDYTAVTGEPAPEDDVPADMLDFFEKKIEHDRNSGVNERVLRFNEQLMEVLKGFA